MYSVIRRRKANHKQHDVNKPSNKAKTLSRELFTTRFLQCCRWIDNHKIFCKTDWEKEIGKQPRSKWGKNSWVKLQNIQAEDAPPDKSLDNILCKGKEYMIVHVPLLNSISMLKFILTSLWNLKAFSCKLLIPCTELHILCITE